ncbi:hypothetical protein BRC93_08030 [Halobacteriales archaeon QS_5_70_15]|nr:MAG: hypothetical protein BRC93_08030 [Halobacteriales archaeon QS_5_70_15]
MVTSVHQLDDGAWLSVDDIREVNVGDLWPVVGDFCGCSVADLLAEGFVEVSVDGRSVEARVAGQCIRCGASGVTDWLELGRVVDGRFEPVDVASVHLPARSGRRRFDPGRPG